MGHALSWLLVVVVALGLSSPLMGAEEPVTAADLVGSVMLDQIAPYSLGSLERQFEVVVVRTVRIGVPDDSDARVALLAEQSRHLGCVLLAK